MAVQESTGWGEEVEAAAIPSAAAVNTVSLQEGDYFHLQSLVSRIRSPGGKCSVPHLVCDSVGRWAPGHVQEHGRVNLTVEVCGQPYEDQG